MRVTVEGKHHENAKLLPELRSEGSGVMCRCLLEFVCTYRTRRRREDMPDGWNGEEL